jgi:carboxyl-terminal processing protease
MRQGLTVWTTLLGVLLLVPLARAAGLPSDLQDNLARAKALEKNGEYARAWELYYQIRKADRNPPEEVTRGYQFCLRRVQQARRFRDKPSQALTADLKASQALTVYTDDVLTQLQNKYVSKVSLGELFQYGVVEMRFALEDDEFLKDHLAADASPAALQALKDRLDGLRAERPAIKKLADAREQLQSVMLAARGLGIKPTAVLVEFVSGACNALDEYTGYLSPRRLAEIEADLSGKFVGIGIDVAVVPNDRGVKQLVIRGVYSASPAAEKMLGRGDVILSIDGETPDPAAPGALVSRLQGEVGTSVELEVASAVDGMKRKVKVERQPVLIPSVDAGNLGREDIGYVRILSFQKTTPQELRSELLRLRSQPAGLRALVLDLRGNLGGSFEAALEVAEMFLSEGVIVYVQSRTQEKVRRAHNPDALGVPLVVLVDGETASAAEVVAGALKDNHRARLVGQTTFGKGSIQCLVKLDSLKAGLNVTVGRFASPEHVFYDARGVAPNEVVENTMATMMGADPQRDRAFELAVRLADEMPPAVKMPPMQ